MERTPSKGLSRPPALDKNLFSGLSDKSTPSRRSIPISARKDSAALILATKQEQEATVRSLQQRKTITRRTLTLNPDELKREEMKKAEPVSWRPRDAEGQMYEESSDSSNFGDLERREEVVPS